MNNMQIDSLAAAVTFLIALIVIIIYSIYFIIYSIYFFVNKEIYDNAKTLLKMLCVILFFIAFAIGAYIILLSPY